MSDRDIQQYRVEVGHTRTGVITVTADDEDEAREKAKERSKENPWALELTDQFTNTVREIDDEE